MVLLLDRLDDTVRSADALAEVTGLPVLGTVPRLTRAQQRSVVTMAEPRSPASESYRTLRTSVQFVQVGTPLRVLHVSSPEQGDGKSLVASNLAVAIAGAGAPHHPHRLRPAPAPCSTSASGWPADRASPRCWWVRPPSRTFLQPVPGADGLWVITAGSIAPNPAEMLASPAAAAVFDQLREMAEVVVVDGPPLLPVTDSQVLARLADATLLVVTAGRSRLNRIRRALDLVNRVDAHVVGTVLNQLDDDAAAYSYLTSGDDLGEPPAGEGDLLAPLPRLSRRSRPGDGSPATGSSEKAGKATSAPVTTATIDGDRTGDGDDGGR